MAPFTKRLSHHTLKEGAHIGNGTEAALDGDRLKSPIRPKKQIVDLGNAHGIDLIKHRMSNFIAEALLNAATCAMEQRKHVP